MNAGTLEVQMLANIVRLQKDMSEARKTVESAVSGIKSAADIGMKALGALGIGLSVNYFKNLITGSLNAMDALDEMSQRTFVSVEALAGLDHAAKMNGTSLATVEKGLKTVSVLMDNAASGASGATAEFAALGISIYDTSGNLKTADQIMVESADRLAQMEDGARKTAAATALYGKAGAELIPMLNGGSAAMAEMVAEGQRLNPVTAKSAAMAAEFNDNIDRLKAGASGLAVSFTTMLLPTLNDVISAVLEFAQSEDAIVWLDRLKVAALAAGVAFTVMNGPIVTVTASVIAFVAAMQGLRSASERALEQSIVNNIKAGADVITFAMYDLVKQIDAANVAIEGLGGGRSAAAKRKELEDEIAELTVTLERYALALGETKRPTEVAAAGVVRYGENVKFTTEALDAHVTARDEYIKAQEESRKKVSQMISALEHEERTLGMSERALLLYNTELEALASGAGPAATRDIVARTAAIYDAKAATEAATDAAKVHAAETERAAEAAQRQWEDTRNFLADTFVEIWNNGGSAFQKLGDMAVATAQRIVAEWAAVKALEFVGIKAPGGSSGVGSSVTSSVLGSILKGGAGGGGMPGGVAGTVSTGAKIANAAGSIGSTVAGAASAVGSAVSSAGSSVMAFAAANPVLAAAAAAAALYAALKKDETPSGNAGFLIRDLPGGGDGRTFDVPAFASGFDPVGFARREDQADAVAVIDTFRQYDAALTQIANAAGLRVDYNSNNFGGFNEKGQGGGLFFGAANEDGRATSVPVEQQLTQFVGQWIKGLGGQVDQSLIQDVLSAGNADDMLKRAAKLAGVDGSHANGLDYVPFDGYRAVLHKGERVMTAAENARPMAGMEPVVAAIGTLRAELADIRRAVARTADIVDNWEGGGLPQERAA